MRLTPSARLLPVAVLCALSAVAPSGAAARSVSAKDVGTGACHRGLAAIEAALSRQHREEQKSSSP